MHCEINLILMMDDEKIQEESSKSKLHVINKGYFSSAFLFKPRGGRRILYLACRMAQAQTNTCY